MTTNLAYDMKPVNLARIDNTVAQRYWSDVFEQGDPKLCPAGAVSMTDDYGRYISGPIQMSRPMKDAACSHYAVTVKDLLRFEALERPQITIQAAGRRGKVGGDFGSMARNQQVSNIYNNGDPRVGFKRTYRTQNDAAPYIPDRSASAIFAPGKSNIYNDDTMYASRDRIRV